MSQDERRERIVAALAEELHAACCQNEGVPFDRLGADTVAAWERVARHVLAREDARAAQAEARIGEWRALFAEAGYTGDHYWTVLDPDPEWNDFNDPGTEPRG